jgi:methyl-accepting chemotaxis protein
MLSGFRGKMEDRDELLRNICIQISRLKTPLESISKNSEPRFIKLGQDLQSVYSDAEKLKKLAVETTGMISGDTDNNLLSYIDNFGKKTLNKLESFRIEVAEIFPRFESCINEIKRFNELCPGIIRIAKMLNMVAFNFSTESSRTESSEEMFGIFVKEIKQLAKEVNDVSYKMKEDSDNSRSSQENEFKKILERKDKLDSTADSAKEIVLENIRRIDEVMNLSLHALRESELHSQKISGLVGDVVMAIQFHDIARQQIEHVMEALQDVEHSIGEKDVMLINPEEKRSLLGKTYSILNLQALQIQQIVLEVSKAHEKITEAFKEISHEIGEIVNGVSRLGLGRTEDNEEKSTFNLLLSGFEKLDMTMVKGEELEGQIDETMKRTSVLASSLSGYLDIIQDLSMQLHIKSINALIMSGKLGQSGGALSALSQYVTEGSKRTDDFVLEVVAILKLIKLSAQDLNRISSKTKLDHERHGDASLRDAISHISGIHDMFIRNAEQSHQSSIAFKIKISGVESGLGFLTDMKRDLEECLKRVKDILDKLGPFSSGHKISVEDMAKIQNRYTMERERGIHQMSVGNDGGDQDKISKETQNNENELGDNVELF